MLLILPCVNSNQVTGPKRGVNELSISFKHGAAAAIFVLGLSVLGIGGALANHGPVHGHGNSGATPPKGGFGEPIKGNRALITSTLQNPNVTSPVKGSYQ